MKSKLFITIFLCIGILCPVFITFGSVKASSVEGMNFYTYEYAKAYMHVKVNIGDYLNSEMKIKKFNISEVKIGKGIYIEDFIENNQLPLFYYPVFINNKLDYIFRIYDDGVGKYTGAFGENSIEEVFKHASKDASNAPLLAVSNGNEILVKDGTYQIVVASKLGLDVDRDAIADYQYIR